jgi:tRNA A37 threonylcarbamoyladenosine biosynthesis protein TsaE
VHHADLYRLGRLSDVEDLGLRELADLGDIVIVEWGNVAEDVLGDHLVVSLEADDDDEDTRRVVVSVVGHTWDSRWEQLQRALAKWGN